MICWVVVKIVNFLLVNGYKVGCWLIRFGVNKCWLRVKGLFCNIFVKGFGICSNNNGISFVS